MGDKKGKIFSSVFWSVAPEREEMRNSVCVCLRERDRNREKIEEREGRDKERKR